MNFFTLIVIFIIIVLTAAVVVLALAFAGCKSKKEKYISNGFVQKEIRSDYDK